MAKSSTNRMRMEQWNVKDQSNKFGDGRQVVNKMTVRNHLGQFHGATNFKGTTLGK